MKFYSTGNQSVHRVSLAAGVIERYFKFFLGRKDLERFKTRTIALLCKLFRE